MERRRENVRRYLFANLSFFATTFPAMLRAMAFSSADVTTIETAIKSGRLKVRYADGQEVTYQSLGQMLALRNVMLREVNAASSSAHQQPRHRLASFADD